MTDTAEVLVHDLLMAASALTTHALNALPDPVRHEVGDLVALRGARIELRFRPTSGGQIEVGLLDAAGAYVRLAELAP